MQTNDPDRQESNEHSTTTDFLVPDDDAVILADGGEEPQDDDHVDLPAAHIQTTATLESVSFELTPMEDVVKFGIRSTDIQGAMFLSDGEIDGLVDDLREAQANLAGAE